MFQGVYNSPYNESVADFGAKRVLGMSGSLTNYINTGNAGTGNAADKDTFEKQQMAKKNKTDKAITAVTLLTLAAAATAGVVAGVKSGKINLSSIKAAFTGLPDKFKKGFEQVKSKFTKNATDKAEKSGETLFSKLKSKFAKKTTDKAEKSGETLFSKLKSKFAKKTETAVTNAVDKEALQEYIDYNSVAKPTKVDLEELDELYRANL